MSNPAYKLECIPEGSWSAHFVTYLGLDAFSTVKLIPTITGNILSNKFDRPVIWEEH